jgi:hypothetical protein
LSRKSDILVKMTTHTTRMILVGKRKRYLVEESDEESDPIIPLNSLRLCLQKIYLYLPIKDLFALRSVARWTNEDVFSAIQPSYIKYYFQHQRFHRLWCRKNCKNARNIGGNTTKCTAKFWNKRPLTNDPVAIWRAYFDIMYHDYDCKKFTKIKRLQMYLFVWFSKIVFRSRRFFHERFFFDQSLIVNSGTLFYDARKYGERETCAQRNT